MNLLYLLFKIGYDNEGFDRDGYNKSGFDRKGFDKDGYNESGFNRNGFDRDGYNSDGYICDNCQFIDTLKKYESNVKDSEIDLALCYLNGNGVRKDKNKAFKLIVEGAFNGSVKCLKLLGDCYYSGNIVHKNIKLAQFIYCLAEGENPHTINQYKAMTPTMYKGLNKKIESAFIEEEKHLNIVVSSLVNEIASIQSKILQVEADTWWMDRDQLDDWRNDQYRNMEKQHTINKLNDIKERPYFARMDSILSGEVQRHYIGEEAYIDFAHPEANVVSVWSEYGRRYRAKNELEFSINGYNYKVTLRRRFDITNSKLNEIFDDYIDGSIAAVAQITDPYLLRVLEEKKGETNITNIIRTIQLKQNDIIEYDFNKCLIVQGCAGSGKTMILLHRLANMKYNLPNLNFKRTKIITPNREFNVFIDELSKNLKIDEIEKLTLNEYYISLLDKYRKGNQELYNKMKEIKVNGAYIQQSVPTWRTTGQSEKDELKTISCDTDLNFDVVSSIYTDKFAEIITREAKKIQCTHENKLDYGNVMNYFNDVFKRALVEMGTKQIVNKNYTCVLYSKLLFLFTYYGKPNDPDSLLCIDEGQDISILQYALIKKINGDKVRLNIYGDLNQQIPGYRGIDSWQRLSKIIEGKVFELDENYRNSDEIIKFYNEKLGLKNKSFGVKTKPVETIQIKNLVTEIKLQLLFKNRTAIIMKDHKFLPADVMELCSSKIASVNKAVLLNVRQAKGLEFDSVFVFENCLNINERYIAYSRALSELFIVINDDVNCS